MTIRSLDRNALNNGLVLSLPFREGAGTVLTHDVAKPRHPISLVNSPTWTAVPAGTGVLQLNGLNEYLECPAADCADLDFTAGDFSILCWCYWTGTSSDIIVGRYELDVSGWEVYFDDTDPLRTLTLRVHHGGAPARTAATSYGWTKDTWWLMGISRSGAYPVHYRNGVALEMSYYAGGIQNPAASGQDLVVGARYTRDQNFYQGMLWNLRAWSRSLAPAQQLMAFDCERHLFGV